MRKLLFSFMREAAARLTVDGCVSHRGCLSTASLPSSLPSPAGGGSKEESARLKREEERREIEGAPPSLPPPPFPNGVLTPVHPFVIATPFLSYEMRGAFQRLERLRTMCEIFFCKEKNSVPTIRTFLFYIEFLLVKADNFACIYESSNKASGNLHQMNFSNHVFKIISLVVV